MASSNKRLSIILPAHNEMQGMPPVLARLTAAYPEAELIVVDDGSDDGTGQAAREAGAKVVQHPYPLGNGAAVKAGARAATGDVLVFLDADGQHDPADIPRLLERLEHGYQMAVGARDQGSQASIARSLANGLYNRAASWMTGHQIADLTSGFRAVRAEPFRKFLSLLPNGFSYPTTITMAFFRSGYPVAYVPIHAARRIGKSHIHPISDGLRFLLIMFRVATLYSPLRIFAPVSAAFWLFGLGYYLYTFVTMTRFTNMSMLLISAGIVVFMMGLVSEQITALSYRDSGR